MSQYQFVNQPCWINWFTLQKKSFNGRIEKLSNCLVFLESQLKSCFQKVNYAWSRLLNSPSSFALLVFKPLLQGAGRCLLGYPGDQLSDAIKKTVFFP